MMLEVIRYVRQTISQVSGEIRVVPGLTAAILKMAHRVRALRDWFVRWIRLWPARSFLVRSTDMSDSRSSLARLLTRFAMPGGPSTAGKRLGGCVRALTQCSPRR